MEFRVLGPLEVLEQGEPVELHGRRQRALLACLLLHANEVVSTERLLDDLWPGGDDSRLVHVLVSRVRKASVRSACSPDRPATCFGWGPESAIARSSSALAMEGRAALRHGRAQEAGTLLRRALALWRGPPFADFAYEPFAQARARAWRRFGSAPSRSWSRPSWRWPATPTRR